MIPLIERTRTSAAAAVRRVCKRTRAVVARLRAGSGDGESGSQLVEIALVMPILLLVTYGMCWFGLAVNNYLVLTNAVQVGAQVLATDRGSSNPCSDVVTAVKNAAPNLNWSATGSSAPVWTINIGGTDYTTSCSSPSTMTSQAQGSVEVQYPLTITSNLFGAGSYTFTLTAETQEVIE